MEPVLMTSTIIGGTSAILNGLFLVFILIYPPRNLGRYQTNYFVGAFASFAFAITQSACAFSFISDGSFLIFVSLRHAGHAVLLLFLTAHNSLFIVIAYNFVHRYALISNNRCLLWFHDRKYLIRSMHCIWFTIAIVPIEALLHVDEAIRVIVIQKYGHFREDFFYALSIEKPLLGSEAAVDFSCMLFVIFGGWNITWMMARYLNSNRSNIISGFSIYRFINRKSKSEKLKQVNLRLLRTLSFQAISSLLFVYMPGVISAGSLIARRDISKFSPLLSSAMSCGTLFNPIIEFILTSEYRQKILIFCGRGKVRKMSSRVEVISSSPNPSLPFANLSYSDINRYRKLSLPDYLV